MLDESKDHERQQKQQKRDEQDLPELARAEPAPDATHQAIVPGPMMVAAAMMPFTVALSDFLHAGRLVIAQDHRRSDASAPANARTTSTPDCASLLGVLPEAMQSRKCWHSTASGSTMVTFGMWTSP